MNYHPPLTFRKSVAVALFILLSFTAGRVSRAYAHAILIRSDPADNSILDEPPAVIRMWFNETIVLKFCSVEILDQDGNLIANPPIQGDEKDLTLMVASVPPLEPGIYTVRWTTYSASDGHIARGYIVFGLGDASLSGASRPEELGLVGKLNIAEIGLRWANYLEMILLMGCLGVLFLLRGKHDSELRPAKALENLFSVGRLRVYRLGKYVTAAALLTGVLSLGWQTASSGGSTPGEITILATSRYILLNTQWGMALIVKLILLGVLLTLFSRYLRSDPYGKPALWPGLILTVGIQATVSYVSHAASGDNPGLSIAVNTAHLVFVGLWIGSLLTLVIVLLPDMARNKAAFKAMVQDLWKPFSWMAAFSVGIVIATGVYSTGMEVASIDGMLLSTYGEVLSAKIALVVLMGVVGALNSVLLHPVLVRPLARLLKKPQGWTPIQMGQFPKMVMVESTLGLLVILSVGVLTTLPPARDPQYLISTDSQAIDEFQVVDDLTVILSIRPNRPGQNIFDIKVLDSRRPPPAETLKVILRTTYLEEDIGTRTYDVDLFAAQGWINTYRLVGNNLAQPGRWQFEVVVRRKGISDTKAVFEWIVLPLGDLRPTFISTQPWRIPLISLSAIMGAGVFLVASFFYIRRGGASKRSEPAREGKT